LSKSLCLAVFTICPALALADCDGHQAAATSTPIAATLNGMWVCTLPEPTTPESTAPQLAKHRDAAADGADPLAYTLLFKPNRFVFGVKVARGQRGDRLVTMSEWTQSTWRLEGRSIILDATGVAITHAVVDGKELPFKERAAIEADVKRDWAIHPERRHAVWTITSVGSNTLNFDVGGGAAVNCKWAGPRH
jgi:hypothetical protein